MKTPLVLLAALSLAACGNDEEPAKLMQPAPASAAAQAAPQQTPAQPHASSGGDNGFLWGLGGYMLGRSMAQSTPSAPAAPSVTNIDRRTYISQPTAPVAPPKPVAATPPPPPPKPATPAPAPAPTPAAKPSYSGPSGYSSVRQSAPTYLPSRSFSSGGRR